jgi:hypothetical protein
MPVTINGTTGITLPDSTTITSNAPPNVTTYTSGSGTYTTPTGAKWLVVEMVGGGGGGSGGGNASTAGVGGTGGTSTFGSSFLTCTGGLGGTQPPAGGSSVIPTGGDINVRGSAGVFGVGAPNNIYTPAGTGGSSVFGGAGVGGYVGSGEAGTSGSGGGGGGILAGGTTTNQYCGGGGGASGYLRKTISSPSATYAYAVGAGGTAGTAGTLGGAGSAGGSGVIIITAYF